MTLVVGLGGTIAMAGGDGVRPSLSAEQLVEAVPQLGAMRNPTLAGADGPANLLAAVRVAGDPAARGLGCVVVMADEIHAAARVRKTHTSGVAAFASPGGGPLGYVAEGRVHIVQRPVARFAMPPLPEGAPIPRVVVCTATLGDDGALLEAVAGRAGGLVVAGFGVGHVPQSWPAVLERIAARIPVVLASRVGAGYVATSTYGFAGSESDQIRRGAIPAGALDPYKSRLLLQLALAHGATRAPIAGAFGAAGGLGDPGAWPWPRPA